MRQSRSMLNDTKGPKDLSWLLISRKADHTQYNRELITSKVYNGIFIIYSTLLVLSPKPAFLLSTTIQSTPSTLEYIWNWKRASGIFPQQDNEWSYPASMVPELSLSIYPQNMPVSPEGAGSSYFIVHTTRHKANLSRSRTDID
jgi:hypothetical protein